MRRYYRLNLQLHDAVMRDARHERARQAYDALIAEAHLAPPALARCSRAHARIQQRDKALIAAAQKA